MRIRTRKSDPKVEWLGSLPWWRDLDHDDLRALAAAGDRVTVPAGQTFMHDGQLGQEAAVIVAGRVEVIHDGDVLAELGPGEVVGELAMLSGDHHRNADVRAATDVGLLVFSVTALRQVMQAAAPIRAQILAAAEAHGGI